MKTDIKQLLKELSTRDLKFKDPTDAKLLNKEKEYHFHDKYAIGTSNFEYSYPCLVELEMGNSKTFGLKRKNEVEQNTVRVDKEAYLKESGMKPMFTPTPQVIDTMNILAPVQPTTPVIDTNIVSDAAAKALIGDFLEKNQ